MTLSALKDFALSAITEHAVIILDVTGRVVEWLGAAEKIFGYSAAEMIGHTLAAVFTHDDMTRDELGNELRTAASSGRAEDDRWMVRKDQSAFWASGVVTPIWDRDSHTAGFVKVLQDRTDLRTHIDTFRKRADAAEAIAERRHVALAAVAHELRSPLAALQNAARILNLPNQSEESRRNAFAIIERQFSFIDRILEDVADATHVDQGRLRLRVSRIELGPVLQQAVEACAGSLGAKNQTVQILASAPIMLEADPTRLRQVFVNLVTNASKFSPQGECIWLKATVEAEEVAVRVEDRGIGISGEFLPRMFELFTQAGTSNTDAGSPLVSGMGLGLPLSKTIVELHHGTIEAKSDGPGKGAQLIVHLPLRQPARSRADCG